MKRRSVDGFFGKPVRRVTRKRIPQIIQDTTVQHESFTSQRPRVTNLSPSPATKVLPKSEPARPQTRGTFIDGFYNKPHLKRIYITRDIQPTNHRFVSVRPSLQTVPVAGTDIAAPTIPSRSLRSRDVVVRLPRKWTIRASIFSILQYIIIAAVAIAAAYSTSIGQWFVLAYALFVISTRQDSRLTFGIALFVLISVPFFQVINQPGVSSNMAVYVYELLVVGTVQALVELKWPKREKPASA